MQEEGASLPDPGVFALFLQHPVAEVQDTQWGSLSSKFQCTPVGDFQKVPPVSQQLAS